MAVALPRIGVSFLILPLLTKENAPVMVRNGFYVCLAIIVLPLTYSAVDATNFEMSEWPYILIKEMFLGLVIGFLFGSVFWALNIAGGILDTQAGTNMASVLDPIQGHQTSLTSQWLGQLAGVIFISSSAFLIFLDVLFTSYTIWPVHELLPSLSANAIEVFINEVNYMMTLALLIAAPGILILAIIDLCFGLVNRFAQQINLLSLTSPIKAWVATWVMMINLGVIVEVLLRKLADNKNLVDLFAKLLT